MNHRTDMSAVPGVPIHSNTTGVSVYYDLDNASSPAPNPAARVKVIARNVTANVVADLIISFCNEHGDLLTNLRLQRLLYFSQGWYLGIRKEPLFLESFQAWASGPVIPEVYARFVSFGASPITIPVTQWTPPNLISDHIREVMEVYGGFSSYDLQRISCNEPPWMAARMGIAPDQPSNNVIDLATLMKFYNGKAQQTAQ